MHSEPPSERQTRVDIYRAGDIHRAGEAGAIHGTWLGCGSLVAPRLVVPHVQLPETTDPSVVCVLSEDGAEAIPGRLLASVDGGQATAVGLESPSSRPVAHTPRIPDVGHGERLDRWLDTIARHSGCSHRPVEQPSDAGLDASWICRIWPTAPGCR